VLLSGTLTCGKEVAPKGTDQPGRSGTTDKTVIRLLPAAGQAGGWTPAGEPVSFRGDRLFDHINGGADIYYEYGFAEVVIQTYEKGEKSISVEIYCMDDPAAAYGIYSYNNHPSLSGIDVGDDATIHPNGLFFWQDRYQMDIRQMGTAAVTSEEFLAIARAIETNIGGSAQKPAVMGLLPRENMVPRSMVFARGRLAIDNQMYFANEDLFGLEKGDVAAIARYRFGEAESPVIVAEYANETACVDAFLRFREHFPEAESETENEFVTAARPPKHHGIRRAGTRLIVVANIDSSENALSMLDRVSEHLQAASGSGGDAQ
jgi:hypothetical protein